MVIDTNNVKEGHSVVVGTTDTGEYRESLPPLEKLVECTATIDRVNAILSVQLEFTAVFKLQCARCLEDFRKVLVGNCRVILQERPGNAGPGKEEDAADCFFDIEHAQVDISGYIFEEIIISLPLMPLCNDECSGIPYADGKTADDGVDPRWEALRKLKK